MQCIGAIQPSLQTVVMWACSACSGRVPQLQIGENTWGLNVYACSVLTSLCRLKRGVYLMICLSVISTPIYKELAHFAGLLSVKGSNMPWLHTVPGLGLVPWPPRRNGEELIGRGCCPRKAEQLLICLCRCLLPRWSPVLPSSRRRVVGRGGEMHWPAKVSHLKVHTLFYSTWFSVDILNCFLQVQNTIRNKHWYLGLGYISIIFNFVWVTFAVPSDTNIH